MKKNDIYKVTCLDLTNQGYGVVRIDSMVVFVSNLLPKESAKIKIVKVLKNYAFGIVLERENDAADRIVPLCKNAHKCGGCSFLHLNYESQLDFKTKYVQSLFKDFKIERCIASKKPYYYRNKAQFPVQIVNGKIQMGFYRNHSHDIIDTKTCFIQDETINEVYHFIYDHIKAQEAKELRHIYIRSNLKKEVQIVFIGKRNCFQSIANAILRQFPNVVSIVFNENKRNDNVILGDREEVLYGSAFLEQECNGQKFQLHFKSFYQVNPKQMELLYDKAIQLAQLSKEDRVIDLYSGVGTIACAIAPYVKEVVGIEIVKEAVENAKVNAKINGLNNVHFVCQDATEFVKEYKEEVDVVFVDPPRKGLTSKGIEHIHGLAPKRIVYISCNPNTLARDVQIFKTIGYSLQLVQPVDMFAQTSGLETIALLEQK